jgi:hypothetical protein
MKSIYTVVVFFFRKCVFYLNGFIQKYRLWLCSPQKKQIDFLLEYKKARNDTFLSFIADNPEYYNNNIADVFYSKKDFQEKMKEENNDLEIEWSQRILFENTPRGNVIMYYNPFRMGFSYYADTSSIPYPLLNAVAMKYSKMFFCCDFFMDNETRFHSPLILIHAENSKKEEEEKKKADGDGDGGADGKKGVDEELKKILNDAPFIKRRKVCVNAGVAPDMKNDKKIRQKDPKEPEYHRNKFIYLGKIHNFTLLKKEEKKNEVVYNGVHADLFNYKYYKMHKMKDI